MSISTKMDEIPTIANPDATIIRTAIKRGHLSFRKAMYRARLRLVAVMPASTIKKRGDPL